MDAATWIALGSAVFAGAAALAASWQAKAAKDQVAIMQEQLRNETDDRHEAAGPIFSITQSTLGSTPVGQDAAEIIVVQKDGPGLSEVTVTTQTNENVRGLIGEDGEKIVDSITWKDNAPGTTRQLIASLDIDWRGAKQVINIVLNFKSVEVGTGATWNRTETTTPDVPFAMRQFRPRRALRTADDSWPIAPSVASTRADNTSWTSARHTG
jgi:hypothetical protein